MLIVPTIQYLHVFQGVPCPSFSIVLMSSVLNALANLTFVWPSVFHFPFCLLAVLQVLASPWLLPARPLASASLHCFFLHSDDLGESHLSHAPPVLSTHHRNSYVTNILIFLGFYGGVSSWNHAGLVQGFLRPPSLRFLVGLVLLSSLLPLCRFPWPPPRFLLFVTSFVLVSRMMICSCSDVRACQRLVVVSATYWLWTPAIRSIGVKFYPSSYALCLCAMYLPNALSVTVL